MMIRIPNHLTGESEKFWHRHAKRLYEVGLLTEADVESFCLLCDIWALIRGCQPALDSKEAIRYVGLAKQYITLAKQFCLLPKDRKVSKMQVEQEIQDEYGL
jgi:hypothetical protein